jgi:hypothetical protein
MNEPQKLPGLHEDEELTIGGVYEGIGWLRVADQGVSAEDASASATFHFVDADQALDVAQRIIGVARAMQQQRAAEITAGTLTVGLGH